MSRLQVQLGQVRAQRNNSWGSKARPIKEVKSHKRERDHSLT